MTTVSPTTPECCWSLLFEHITDRALACCLGCRKVMQRGKTTWRGLNTVNKLGRKAPKNAPALMFSQFRRRGGAVTHDPTVDYLAGLGGWKMLGNGPDPENQAAGVPPNGAGDCVAVTWANQRRLVTASLGGQEYYPTLAQVIALYKTQNPNFPAQDEGMDIQTALEYLHTTGGPDGVKCLAFGKVNFHDIDEVKAAIETFGQLWVGVNVEAINQQQFDRGAPWDYSARSPIEGGHSVDAGGFLGQIKRDVCFISWGKETTFTDNFWRHLVEEAWVVVWPEHLIGRAFHAGVDITALAAAYQELTGSALPVPAPPEPAPNPAPGPQPGPSGFTVGDGVRQAMMQVGVVPASSEQPLNKYGDNGWISLTVDSAGRMWVWIPALGKAVRLGA